jgi:hypothetical protein
VRVIVCGSRQWADAEAVLNRLAELPRNSTVVHGGSKGADQMAGRAASLLSLKVEVYEADWDRYGKRAGFLRNEQMAAAGADLCIAFWDGQSKGTQHMTAICSAEDIPVEIIHASR